MCGRYSELSSSINLPRVPPCVTAPLLPRLPLLTRLALSCLQVRSIAGCPSGAPRITVIYGTTSPIIGVGYSELSNPLNLPMARAAAPPPKPQRGRPRDPERGRRVLEAAQRHFNEHGLERASMDDIAADAGVSKMTVYSNFGSKERLFQAVVGDRTATVGGGL